MIQTTLAHLKPGSTGETDNGPVYRVERPKLGSHDARMVECILPPWLMPEHVLLSADTAVRVKTTDDLRFASM